VPQCCSLDAGPGGWTLTLQLTLDPDAPAVLGREQARRRTDLLSAIRERVRASAEQTAW
jgi:hypothetical protein